MCKGRSTGLNDSTAGLFLRTAGGALLALAVVSAAAELVPRAHGITPSSPAVFALEALKASEAGAARAQQTPAAPSETRSVEETTPAADAGKTRPVCIARLDRARSGADRLEQ